MLFHSPDFLVFFAVVVAQYFRVAPALRWPTTAVGLLYPVLAHGPVATSLAAALFSVLAIGAVEHLHHRERSDTARKLLLVCASLLFYGAWRWPYTGLLLFSIALDHRCAWEIHRSTDPTRRRPGRVMRPNV